MKIPPSGANRLRGLLLAAITLLSQALLARVVASLAANVIALIALAPWTVLLLFRPHPTSAEKWWVTGVTVAMLSVSLAGLLVASRATDSATEQTYVSQADDANDRPRFEMTGPELKVSGVSADVWGDTILVTCMTRAGAYTDEEGYYAIEDLGDVATAQAEWPAGDQSLTVFFTDPLNAPPAICAIEGSGGDIGAAAFCDTGDRTEIPGARGDSSGSYSGDEDGKVAILVDEICAGEAI